MDDVGQAALVGTDIWRFPRASWPAWLMAPTGLRISWAMLADSRPSAASLPCCTRSAMRLVSSRKISVGPGAMPPRVRSAAGSRARRRRRRSSMATLRPLALPPGRQRVQEARRYLAHQGTRNGVVVAENLRCGFVDEADLIGGVDHQQAFAQVLHDVLRQLREVREVDVFLANQILALAHAAGDEARGGSDDEQHRPEQAGGRVGVDIGVPPSCCQMVSARTAMAAMAARNSALRGGSRNANAPTGTRNSRPRPLATPPQACSSRSSTNMSTVACRMVCT